MSTQDLAQLEAQLIDTQLVHLVAQGDGEALGQLYDRYSKALYSYVVRILKDPWEAEDVLQETFMKVWEKAPSFDDTVGKPFNWVMTLTRNRAIDRVRARQRKPVTFVETTDDASAAPSKADNPHDAHARRDQAAQLAAAVNQLPNHQRQPIELAFFSGLTHREIACALEEPLGTIKDRIRRGMLRLRSGLEGAL